jgi:hypothetical protein
MLRYRAHLYLVLSLHHLDFSPTQITIYVIKNSSYYILTLSIFDEISSLVYSILLISSTYPFRIWLFSLTSSLILFEDTILYDFLEFDLSFYCFKTSVCIDIFFVSFLQLSVMLFFGEESIELFLDI